MKRSKITGAIEGHKKIRTQDQRETQEETEMYPSLLVKTQDGGYLLAEPGDQASMLLFAKSFGAELYRVESKLKPRTLVQVNDLLNHPDKLSRERPHTTKDRPVYLPVVPTAGPSNTVVKKENYKEFLDRAADVKGYIQKRLVRGDSLALTDLILWAQKEGIGLSKGGLSRHLQKVLDWAVGAGYTKVKEGRSYKIIKP